MTHNKKFLFSAVAILTLTTNTQGHCADLARHLWGNKTRVVQYAMVHRSARTIFGGPVADGVFLIRPWMAFSLASMQGSDLGTLDAYIKDVKRRYGQYFFDDTIEQFSALVLAKTAYVVVPWAYNKLKNAWQDRQEGSSSRKLPNGLIVPTDLREHKHHSRS